MGQLNFVSPGAMGADAFRQELLRRALLQRQQQEDAFKRQQAEIANQREAEQLALQQQQEARIAQAQRQVQADLENQRESQRAGSIYENAIPGVIQQSTLNLLHKHGYDLPTTQGQPTQGAQMGEDEQGVPLYDVIPGVLQTTGGTRWQAARQAAQERADLAAATAAAAAERTQADERSRELIARILAESRRDTNAGHPSDYAHYLQRWAADRGTTPEKMTGAQEIEARRGYYAASRASGLAGLLADTGDDADVPAPPAPSSAGGGRTASVADVRAVAQRAGISEVEARRRLEAAGVVIQPAAPAAPVATRPPQTGAPHLMPSH